MILLIIWVNNYIYLLRSRSRKRVVKRIKEIVRNKPKKKKILTNQIKRIREKMEEKIKEKKRKIMIEEMIKKGVIQEKRDKNKLKMKVIKRRMIRETKEEVQLQDEK